MQSEIRSLILGKGKSSSLFYRGYPIAQLGDKTKIASSPYGQERDLTV
ncbi:hypothetical protein HMP0721_1163 [Pseudoramibacter alactolyticus ATCC 23263]|uniref:Uncharacterized protein n=1 Tax=Pseudoramibacter alactolyticus ATCC 23263 TaxID=887929 RepID=E6MGN0_9FIRM|nr:hypothetical protein HMP0721_1163 [Pseudoramibacter alactolyticus ATCC 23263]